MGIDLTLCPDKQSALYGLTVPTTADWHLAYCRLKLHRHAALFDAMSALKPVPLPANVRFSWYGDEGLEDRTTDPYGGPLTYLPAGVFHALDLSANMLTLHRHPPLRLDPWNAAILHFLRAVPDHTRVVLWWH
jgi:hypothetical protein